LLIIDKHLGPTSMQVCASIRARLRRAGAPKRIKVGHAGTLDPLATGVLVVLIGKATKRVPIYMGQPKSYLATIDLTAFSTTDDAEGEQIPVTPARIPDLAEINGAVAAFVGIIQQRPPAFSAINIAGRRAYDMARRGEEVTLPPRPVTVHAIEVLNYEWPTIELRIDCGKGTYIRSIARDLGVALGTGGRLTALRRTAVGDLTIDRARTLATLPGELTQADLLPL
jgi:tRNA pseudouridine55 synthase